MWEYIYIYIYDRLKKSPLSIFCDYDRNHFPVDFFFLKMRFGVTGPGKNRAECQPWHGLGMTQPLPCLYRSKNETSPRQTGARGSFQPIPASAGPFQPSPSPVPVQSQSSPFRSSHSLVQSQPAPQRKNEHF